MRSMEFPYALGASLVRADRLEQALEVLDRAFGRPASCLRHLIRGQFEEAQHALGELEDEELRDFSDVAVELGLARVRGGDLEAADRIWRLVAAVGDAAGRAEASAFLAAAREELGDISGASRSWQQTTGSAADTWRRMSSAFSGAGDRERGQGAMERAVQLHASVGSRHAPDQYDAAFELGLVAYRNGDLPTSVLAFSMAASCDHIDRFDQSVAAARNLLEVAGQLHDSDGHVQAARALHRLAIAGYPQKAEEQAEEYGKALRDAEQLAAAEPYFRAISEFGNADAAAMAGLQLGHLLINLGRPEEADETLAGVGDSGVAKVARLAEFSRYALHKDSDESAADEILERLVNGPGGVGADVSEGAPESDGSAEPDLGDGPDSAEELTLYLYATRLADQGERERAGAMFRTVYQGGGEWSAAAALSLGVEANRIGDTAQACAWWLCAVDDEGDAGENAIANLGVVHKKEQLYAEAEQWWRRLLDSFPHRRAQAAAHIGEMYYWQEYKQQAVEWYRITLAESEDPELVGEAAFRTGEYLVENDEDDAARGMLIRAVEMAFEPFASSASELLRHAEREATAPPAPHSSPTGADGDGPQIGEAPT